MPTPGTSEHSRKHKIYNDTSSSNKLVLSCLPGQPKPQHMPDVLGEHQFIMLENLKVICVSTNRAVPFMSQSLIVVSDMLCHFMPNDRSLWCSSLIPSIPPQKLSFRFKLTMYTRHIVHMSCFRTESYLLRPHNPNGNILLYLLEFPCLCRKIESCRISVGCLKQMALYNILN